MLNRAEQTDRPRMSLKPLKIAEKRNKREQSVPLAAIAHFPAYWRGGGIPFNCRQNKGHQEALSSAKTIQTARRSRYLNGPKKKGLSMDGQIEHFKRIFQSDAQPPKSVFFGDEIVFMSHNIFRVQQSRIIRNVGWWSAREISKINRLNIIREQSQLKVNKN